MDYQIATVILKDGRQFEQAVITAGRIARIKGVAEAPFFGREVVALNITHDKWDWSQR